MLFVYLSSSTQLHEIFKLPTLVEHFLEHHSANNSLSFFEFLKMHYTNGDVKSADYEKDMKLPFKSHDVCDYFVATFSMLPKHPQIKQPVHIQEALFLEFKHNFKGSSLAASIWQPPKLA